MFDDPFENSGNSLTSPAVECFDVIPDDSQDLARATKAIFIGSGGDIVVRAVGSSSDVILRNTISGSILDIRVCAIRSTGTTAQNIVGLV